MDMRPIHAAAGRGDYAVVLRLGRTGRGWTQAQLARRANVSRTVVSRFETGDRMLRDVDLRRRFADALDLPIQWFGLSGPTGPKVGDTREEGEDEVRRRAFLVVAGAAIITERSIADAAPVSLRRRIEQALLHPERGTVLDPKSLPAILAAARTDYQATHYLSLSDRFAGLVASAEAQVDQRPEPAAHALLADVYHAMANFLCKLPASELEWVAVDRALRAARMAGDPMRVAESQRLLSTVYRRAGRPREAFEICSAAAEQLHRTGGPECELRVAEMLCTAAYGAAKAGDRERAVELLRDARLLADRPPSGGQPWTGFSGVTAVKVYVVSVGVALGDLGLSFAAMREVRLPALVSIERQARFLVDAATARLAAGQPGQAARTLLLAERIAPQSVATRPAAAALRRALPAQET